MSKLVLIGWDAADWKVITGHQIVILSITYTELTFAAINKKASPKMPGIVDKFVKGMRTK